MTAGTLRVGAHLLILGRTFSPSRAESTLGLAFGSSKNEPEDIGTRGRFEGTPTPYGSASWNFYWDSGELLPTSLDLFKVPDLSRRLTELGADSVTLYIYVGYRGQCNLELTPDLLKALAGLNLTVGISCYETDDSDDE